MPFPTSIRRTLAALVAACASTPLASQAAPSRVVLTDSHFHLTNYVQRGPTLKQFLPLMGDSIGRVALFGIPLQQEWLDAVTGDNAPTYYLHSDAPLYYYSFTDAYIAMEYRSLSPAEQARFDPMITGFNPSDMYAADHIRRVLRTFPGVFTGIGEFTIHKEFVSDKVRPGPASLLDPALDSVLALAGEVGLVAIIHNDMDVPFASRHQQAGVPRPDEGAHPAPSEHDDHLGAHRASAASFARSRGTPRSSPRCSPIRRSRISISTSRGTWSRSIWSPHPRRSVSRPI